jgi:translation initiation factor 3 subunit L
MEALYAEDAIAVDDLPNFRVTGTTQFDVEQAAAAPAEDIGTSWDDSVEKYDMPDVIRSFIVFFQKQMRDGNVEEVSAIYETSFNKLTDRYYKSSPWPPAEAISPLVDGDKQFLLLYKELYFRHIYSKLQPTLEQRMASFANYCDIFNLLLGADKPISVNLPVQWLWDIVDEFIYQFQTFCQYRSRMKGKTEDELKALKENPDVWSVVKVLHYLQKLADKSDIVAHLNGEKESSPFLEATTYKMLGYFSLVGLLRVHCLLGDYRLALASVAAIDINKKGPAPHGLFTRVTLCHITLFYYVGWSYLMLRRYTDAIKTFSSILFYIARTKQYHTRSYQYDQIVKKNEQMYALLAIAASLSPGHALDENLVSSLRDKYGDRMSRMQSNHVDTSAYDELFSFACPKFISPAPPPYDSLPATYNAHEAYRLQLRLFMVSPARSAATALPAQPTSQHAQHTCTHAHMHTAHSNACLLPLPSAYFLSPSGSP